MSDRRARVSDCLTQLGCSPFEDAVSVGGEATFLLWFTAFDPAVLATLGTLLGPNAEEKDETKGTQDSATRLGDQTGEAGLTSPSLSSAPHVGQGCLEHDEYYGTERIVRRVADRQSRLMMMR